MRVDDARPEAAGQMQPVDAFLEERVAAGQCLRRCASRRRS